MRGEHRVGAGTAAGESWAGVGYALCSAAARASGEQQACASLLGGDRRASRSLRRLRTVAGVWNLAGLRVTVRHFAYNA